MKFVLFCCFLFYFVLHWSHKEKGTMIDNTFIVRIPKDLGTFFQDVSETRKWSYATTLREIVKTSPFYSEFLKKIGGS